MQNPLESYRRTQRELRRNFETFTRANCPTCPTPCCRRPARIAPTDILLAEATGWRANLPSAGDALNPPADRTEGVDMVTTVATRMMDALSNDTDGSDDNSNEENANDSSLPQDLPCEYLGVKGCTFPQDLRPFGCTTYICKYMYARLDRATLTRIKRLVRELDDKHSVLMRSVDRSRLPSEREE